MNRTTLQQLGVFAILCTVPAAPALADDDQVPAAPAAPEPGVLQRGITWASGKFDATANGHDGFYPELGHMVPGAGWLTIGPGYRHHLFGDRAVLDTSAAVSWRRYSMARTNLQWPALFSNHLSLGTEVKYEDFTQINYFGVGAEAPASARTNYRLTNVDASGGATVKIAHGVSIGARGGYMRGLDVRRGLSTLYPSIEARFDEASAPGLDVQPRYEHADVFVEADSRDVPGYPTRGGIYRLSATAYRDADRSGHSFHRLDSEATQFVPLFHDNSVIAVRGRVTMSQASGGNTVPFYLLPSIGGEDTLRGYSAFRFRDRNAAVFSAEYRWRVLQIMDAALFADAGTVGASAADLWRQSMSRDYGFGVRLHSSSSSIARFDIARGHEGTRLVFSLSAPLGPSRRDVAPYVP